MRPTDVILAVTAAVLVGGAAGEVSAQQPMTLEQCVERALAENPRTDRADRQVVRSGLQRQEAATTLLPSVFLNGAYSRYTSVSPQQLLNPATNQIIEGSTTAYTSTSYYAGLSVSQQLFNRAMAANYQQAVSQVRSAEASASLEQQRLVLEVHQAYYGLLRAERNLVVAEADVDYNDGLLRQVRTMRNLGSRAEVDVLRQESALAQARQRRIAAENALAKARADLNYLMARPLTAELVIADDLEEPATELSLQSALDRALEAHPSIRQAVLGMASAEAGVESARAARYPSVSLRGDYSWRGDSYLDIGDALDRDYTWSLGLSVSVPLFTGTRTTIGIERSRVELSGARVEYDAAEEAVRREVYRAVLDLEEARQSLATARQSVTLASETLRLSEELYRLGNGTLLEVNASQLDLINARYQEVQALFALKVAGATLDFAIGGLR
jgi:outer membrane protein TolC